jgi:hypothetical protein
MNGFTIVAEVEKDGKVEAEACISLSPRDFGGATGQRRKWCVERPTIGG